jgi:hypothetical protein
MAEQARDLQMRTEDESSVIITARACLVLLRLLAHPLIRTEVFCDAGSFHQGYEQNFWLAA